MDGQRSTNLFLSSFRSDAAGAAAAEFAIIVPLLLLLIVGIYAFGRLYWTQNALQYAADQLARCVMVESTGGTAVPISGTGVPCSLAGNLGGLGTNNVVVAENVLVSPCSASATLGSCQLIKLTYNYSLNPALAVLMGLFGGGLAPSLTLTGQAEAPVS